MTNDSDGTCLELHCAGDPADAAQSAVEERFESLLKLRADAYWETDAQDRLTSLRGECLQGNAVPAPLRTGCRFRDPGAPVSGEANAWVKLRPVLERRRWGPAFIRSSIVRRSAAQRPVSPT